MASVTFVSRQKFNWCLERNIILCISIHRTFCVGNAHRKYHEEVWSKGVGHINNANSIQSTLEMVPHMPLLALEIVLHGDSSTVARNLLHPTAYCRKIHAPSSTPPTIPRGVLGSWWCLRVTHRGRVSQTWGCAMVAQRFEFIGQDQVGESAFPACPWKKLLLLGFDHVLSRKVIEGLCDSVSLLREMDLLCCCDLISVFKYYFWFLLFLPQFLNAKHIW